jgi:D-glycero-alpha-D-manno-heptose-7-phosphate kinase
MKMSSGDLRIVTTKTPLRITFTGGGTDLPQYYRNYGPGVVVSAAIDRYIYISVSRNFRKDEIRVSYSKTENGLKSVNEIQHPTVREAMKLLDIGTGIQIVSITEVPSGGTGLGSSSSFLVGLLNALHTWIGETVSPRQLADEAVKIERNILGEPGGKQDQYIAAFGGVQYMEFERNENVTLKRINIKGEKLNELNDQLMMFYTGVERKSVDIHKDQSNGIEINKLGYDRMRDIAIDTKESLENYDFYQLGKLMNENWNIKKSLSKKISQDLIDNWYSQAINAGAIGGKLIGAGGGGFLLFLTPLERQNHVMDALNVLERHRIQIENLGSRVVFLE